MVKSKATFVRVLIAVLTIWQKNQSNEHVIQVILFFEQRAGGRSDHTPNCINDGAKQQSHENILLEEQLKLILKDSCGYWSPWWPLWYLRRVLSRLPFIPAAFVDACLCNAPVAGIAPMRFGEKQVKYSHDDGAKDEKEPEN